MEERPRMRGRLRERRGATWVLRHWELTKGGELTYVKKRWLSGHHQPQDSTEASKIGRYQLVSGCAATPVEPIEVKKDALRPRQAGGGLRRLYAFAVSWPPSDFPRGVTMPDSAAAAAADREQEGRAKVTDDEEPFDESKMPLEEEEDGDDRADEDNEEAARLAQQRKGTQPGAEAPAWAGGPCRAQERETGNKMRLLSVGAAGLVVGLGWRAAGVLVALGCAVAFFLAVLCGIAFFGGGGASTQCDEEAAETLLVLASQSRGAACRWREAVVAAIGCPETTESDSTHDPWLFEVAKDGTFRLGGDNHDPEIVASFLRGLMVRKKRVGTGTLACARVVAEATPLRTFVALLGGEQRLLAKRGGIVYGLEQVEALDERSDVARLLLRPLAPSLGEYRCDRAALVAVLEMARASGLALVGALPRARSAAIKALWLAWGVLARLAQILVAPKKGEPTTLSGAALLWIGRRLYRATHVAAHEFRVIRTWHVTDEGVYVVELRTDAAVVPDGSRTGDDVFAPDPPVVDPAATLGARFSVAPLKGDGKHDQPVANVVVRLELELPGVLARSARTSIKTHLRDRIASLYADELALFIVDLRDALDTLVPEEQPGEDDPKAAAGDENDDSEAAPAAETGSAQAAKKGSAGVRELLDARVAACEKRVKLAEAAVATASPEDRRHEASELQRRLAEHRRLAAVSRSGDDDAIRRALDECRADDELPDWWESTEHGLDPNGDLAEYLRSEKIIEAKKADLPSPPPLDECPPFEIPDNPDHRKCMKDLTDELWRRLPHVRRVMEADLRGGGFVPTRFSEPDELWRLVPPLPPGIVDGIHHHNSPPMLLASLLDWTFTVLAIVLVSFLAIKLAG